MRGRVRADTRYEIIAPFMYRARDITEEFRRNNNSLSAVDTDP